jgi:uncharacterized membrane protein
VETVQQCCPTINGGAMKVEKILSETVAKKIWHQYFRRVKRCARPLKSHQQEELILEIQDHLLESFKQKTGNNEAEKLLNAIDKLGDPEEYLRPMIADRLLSSASSTLNPKTVFKGLYYDLFGNVKSFLLSLAFSLGYLAAFVFAVLSILKIFFPDNIGFFINETGGILIGIIGGESLKTDILGFWNVPLGLLVSLIIYLVLTRNLKVVKRGMTSPTD